MNTASVRDHRERETGVLVYPVYSRRSGGLSIGINLFPDRKVCSFDCPYCEVFPFDAKNPFSLPEMETALIKTLIHAKEQNITVRDICFSGNGEPTVSPDFTAALEAAFRIRDKEVPDAEVVLITNGTGLLDDDKFKLLGEAAKKDRGLQIWLKLDAGTLSWYKAMNRSSISYEILIKKIREFVRCTPLILQTMICAIDGKPPPAEEERAWENLTVELALGAAELRGIQIYGKARPAPEDPLATALPESFLEARAASVRTALTAAGKQVKVRVYV